jgi:hypothetical protein
MMMICVRLCSGTMNARRCIAGVALGVVSGAAVGGAPDPFTEEAADRGIEYITDQAQAFGQGLAFADLDDDGDPDVILIGRADGLVGVYENDGTGHFIDRSDSTGIELLLDTSGVIAGDYDDDGDLDVHIGRWGVTDVLLRNDGGFQFADVAGIAGVGDQRRAAGCAWGDYNLDGRLDLYVANRGGQLGQPNRLYHNNGDGTFTDVAGDLGVACGDDPTYQSAFLDFDRDGDADLYVATDKSIPCLPGGWRNRLFENVGGAFIDITEESGTEACVNAMCIAIGDFDGNGWPDLYSTNTPSGNALMVNNGDGTFQRFENIAGVASFLTGWGSVFFDYDNDGRLDLHVCNMLAPNRLYRRGPTWPCVDLASPLEVDVPGDSFCCAVADVDDDGDVDLLVQTVNEPVRLFINHEGEKRNWVKFDVIGEGSNRWAIGANIDALAGKTRQLREIIAGCNYKAQNELIQHIGLGDAGVVDEVTVMWPGGATRTLWNLPAGQTWTVYPEGKLADGDQDGDVDRDDVDVMSGCLGGPVQPGCEMMDINGDGMIDESDVDAFVARYEGPLTDCNGDGVLDVIEIIADGSLDDDRTGILDACEQRGDLDGSGAVASEDLEMLIEAWGPCGEPCPADLTGDGVVNVFDLLVLLANWD